MRTVILILITFFHSACVVLSIDKQHPDIHPELRPYVEEIVMMSKGRIRPIHLQGLTMGFKKFDSNDNVIGLYKLTSYEIDINIDWWINTPSQTKRFELIAHEIGHAVLKRGHTSGTGYESIGGWLERTCFYFGFCKTTPSLEDGCPASLMHPYSIDEQCLDRHLSHYIEELFERETSVNN